MRKVIMIDETKEPCGKPVEFTHCRSNQDGGWEPALIKPKYFDKIVYLGECVENGDLFAAYMGFRILIYKGHLNSGAY